MFYIQFCSLFITCYLSMTTVILNNRTQFLTHDGFATFSSPHHSNCVCFLRFGLVWLGAEAVWVSLHKSQVFIRFCGYSIVHWKWPTKFINTCNFNKYKIRMEFLFFAWQKKISYKHTHAHTHIQWSTNGWPTYFSP